MSVMLRENLSVGNYKDILVITSRDDLMDGNIRLALSSLNIKEVQDLVILLNSIANQGITSIDVDKLTYDINGAKDIKIENMCSAEKLYMLAYLAKLGKLNIVIEANMLEFEKNTLHCFLALINDLDNFTVVAEDEFQEHLFREVGGLL